MRVQTRVRAAAGAQVAAPTAEQVRCGGAAAHDGRRGRGGAGGGGPRPRGDGGAEMARGVAELSLANRLPNLRKEEFLDLVPAASRRAGPTARWSRNCRGVQWSQRGGRGLRRARGVSGQRCQLRPGT